MKSAFYFYANPFHPRSSVAARALQEALCRKGADIYADPDLAAQGIGRAADVHALPEDVRAVIAFGGDGTLLRIAADAALQDVPMLGVHTGTVGFLMAGDAEKPEETAALLMAGEYRYDFCPLLETEFENKRYLALNDISITRGEHPGVVEVSVWADEELVYSSHGDGMLLSTPLGSTAYCLAAGGPIVRPDTLCLILTPLCARELLQRSVVLPLDTVITLRAHGRTRRRLQLAIDGQTLLPVTEEAKIQIHPAKERLRLISAPGRPFFSTLRKKQAIWNQQEEQE